MASVHIEYQPLRPFGRFVRRSAIGLGLVAVLVILGAALLMLLQAGWPPVARVNRGVADGLGDAFAGRPVATNGLTAITALGGNPVMWWLATVTAGGMLLRRQLHLAGYLVVVGLGALALAPAVKLLVGWVRPQ